MNSALKRRLTATSAILGVAVLGLGLSLIRTQRAETPASTPRTVDSARPAASAAAGSALPRAGQPAIVRSATQPAMPAAIIPAPPALQRVLPSVREAVADWRLFAPEHLTVEAVPGAPVEFECVEVKRGGPAGEFTIWIGRNAAIPGASFVGVGAAGRWVGSQTIPGADEYVISVFGDNVSVREKTDGACAEPLALASGPATTALGNASAATTAELSVDVFFFYGEEVAKMLTEAVAGSSTTVQEAAVTVATNDIEKANQMLAQSGVTKFRWRMAGAAKVPYYMKSKDLEGELTKFADKSSTLGEFAYKKLVEVGADQAVLWIHDDREEADTYAGIANMPGQYSVLYIQASTIVLAHEMAHNFGCNHDRQESAKDRNGAKDGDGKYNYGHRFTNNGKDCGTIMSYAELRIPYFSNPKITVPAETFAYSWGPGELATGVAADQPKAADNARWLNEHAESVSNNRELVSMPAITTQPASTSVTVGRSFTLSVTATGGNLTYQWSKGGAAITGATTASYTKSNAAAADAGSYTVKVSNNLGSVVSSAASVTVSEATTPADPQPTPPTTDKGGGGGALPAWFLALFAVLAGARSFRRTAHTTG